MKKKQALPTLFQILRFIEKKGLFLSSFRETSSEILTELFKTELPNIKVVKDLSPECQIEKHVY